jgi:hypothetical protein
VKHLLPFLAVVASAAAQSATVSTIADSGVGSLRAALTAANASTAATFTINIASGGTAGPIVLTSSLPSLTKSNVTIGALSGAGRLIIDARLPTASGGSGLDLAGNDIQVLAPCRLLVQQGHGVMVHGDRARLADFEANGSMVGVGLLVFAGADDLVVGRFFADSFQLGISLTSCARAHIANDGVSTAEVRNGGGPGIQITGGSDHRIDSFVCAANELGVFASNSPNLLLGRAGSPRSQVTGSRQQGILLMQCTGATLVNADLVGNGMVTGGHGVQVIGGNGIAVSDVQSWGNVFGGLAVEGGATRVRIGPNVSTRGVPGLHDVGLTVRSASAVTIVDSTFGPDHESGALLGPEASGWPVEVSLCRCTITGNRVTGLSVLRASNTLVCSGVIAGNMGTGIEAVGPSLATAPRKLVVADCLVGFNAGNGMTAQTVDGVQIGPGGHVDYNLAGGLQFFDCVNAVVTDVLSIDGNRDGGIWFVDSNDAVVARSAFRDDRGAGIYALRCSGLAIGPDVAIRNTVGTGLQLEICSGCRMFSSQITASTAHGVQVVASSVAPGTSPHVLRSCLIADHPGLALLHSGGPLVKCELCTIAGNLRGIDAGPNPLALDSCIVCANTLADLDSLATAMTVNNTIHQIPPPAPASTNTNADPLFVSPAARDWRLQSGTPASGYANQAMVIAPGSLDAWGGQRVVGGLDAGAFEVGAHAPPGARLLLSSSTMSNGGGGLAFHVRYPSTSAGALSIVLAQLGAPSGSFPAFGAVIPLAYTQSLLFVATDVNSVNTMTGIGPEGVVGGALLWAGRLPPSVQNQVVSLCAVALNFTPAITSVSNVASFTIL